MEAVLGGKNPNPTAGLVPLNADSIRPRGVYTKRSGTTSLVGQTVSPATRAYPSDERPLVRTRGRIVAALAVAAAYTNAYVWWSVPG